MRTHCALIAENLMAIAIGLIVLESANGQHCGAGGAHYGPPPITYYRPSTPMYAPPAQVRPSYESRRSYAAPPRDVRSPSDARPMTGRQRSDSGRYTAGRASAEKYAPTGPTTNIGIGAYDNYFEPREATVQPGTTVRFVNKGKHSHTVTANDGAFDSGDLPPGQSYKVTFLRPGTYHVHCLYHTNDKMQGTIVVGGGGRQASREVPNRRRQTPGY